MSYSAQTEFTVEIAGRHKLHLPGISTANTIPHHVVRSQQIIDSLNANVNPKLLSDSEDIGDVPISVRWSNVATFALSALTANSASFWRGLSELQAGDNITLTPNGTALVIAAAAAASVEHANTADFANAADFANMADFAESANTANTAAFANNTLYLNGQAASFYLNATNITTGTLPLGRLTSANTIANGVVDTIAQSFAGVKTFTENVVVSKAFSVTGNTSLTGNLSAGNASFSTIIAGLWNGTLVGPTFGGTGLSAFAVGDIIYGSDVNVLSVLPGNFTSTQKFLTQTGNGTFSAAPFWGTIASGASLTFFFYITASDISTYYVMKTPASTGGDQTITNAGLATGNTYLANFATLSGIPSITFMPAGVCTCYVTARQSSGTKVSQLFAEFYKRAAGGTETLLATSALTIPLTGVDAAYIFQGAIPAADVFLLTDRLVTKIVSDVSGGGSAPTVVLTIEGVTAARSETPSAAVDATTFVPYIGATANVNLGVHALTLTGIVSAGNTTVNNTLTIINGPNTALIQSIFASLQIGTVNAEYVGFYANNGNILFSVNANQTLTANAPLTVTSTSTLTGNVLVSGRLLVNSLVTANAGLASNQAITLTNGVNTSSLQLLSGSSGLQIGTVNAQPLGFYANNGDIIFSVNADRTLTANAPLTVNSTAHIVGNVTHDGLLTQTGNATFSGFANLASTLQVAGLTTLTGNATLSGFANIASTLQVAGLTTLTGNATLAGFANIATSLNVGTTSHLVGNITADGLLTQTGNATFSGFANIATSLNVGTTSHLVGNITADGLLTQTGNATFSGFVNIASTLQIVGAITTQNTITANGSVGSAGATLTSGGSSANVYWNTSGAAAGAMTLLFQAEGTSTANSNTDVATYALASGLTVKDSLRVHVTCSSNNSAAGITVNLRNTTDSLNFIQLVSTAGGTLGNGFFQIHDILIMADQTSDKQIAAVDNVFGATTGGTFGTAWGQISTFTTAWTGNWTIGLRQSGVASPSAFRYRIAIYKVAGQ